MIETALGFHVESLTSTVGKLSIGQVTWSTIRDMKRCRDPKQQLEFQKHSSKEKISVKNKTATLEIQLKKRRKQVENAFSCHLSIPTPQVQIAQAAVQQPAQTVQQTIFNTAYECDDDQ
ncbi:UNVERIFIED_CONTAM: hypothetical protein HDU68_011972 [Siphonaria sp. JEL0065]|nr:hypothetical protein HDU68_011972 [Siphonaria sp. JEL0065]